MKEWTRVTNVAAFLAEKGVRRVRAHHDMSKRILHWPYCAHCGIVRLRNAATEKVLRAPCVTWEDA